jgi:hypothetical protein
MRMDGWVHRRAPSHMAQSFFPFPSLASSDAQRVVSVCTRAPPSPAYGGGGGGGDVGVSPVLT